MMTQWSVILNVIGIFTPLYKSVSWGVTLWLIRRRDFMTDLAFTSKMRFGSDPRPIWVLFGTPSTLYMRSSLSVWWSTAYCNGCHYIFLNILFILLLLFILLCTAYLWHIRFGWLLVRGLYKENLSQMCVFMLAQLLWLVRRLGYR